MGTFSIGHVIALTLLIAQCRQTAGVNMLREVFKDETNNGNFKHVVIDKNTGKVYMGAVNRLYQLTETLDVEKAVTTGPQLDNHNCPGPPHRCYCSSDKCRKVPTNSYNKVLLIDYGDNQLIVCSNLFQGRCDKRSLADISVLEEYKERPEVVANDDQYSAVVFIAPGPSPSGRVNNVLYAAVTRSNVGTPIYNDQKPAISTRNLQTYAIAHRDFQAGTFVHLEIQQRAEFRVDYRYGFSSGGFSYFIAVQKESVVDSMSANVTRIVRLCQNDTHYYSYTEIPLECRRADVNYNVLVAAYVSHPGGRLARTLGLPDMPPLTDSEDVLFALFSQSDPKSRSASPRSALCVYSLREIRRRFTRTIQNCFNGLGNTGPAHIIIPHTCAQSSYSIGDNYCGQYDMNQPISGSDAVSKQAALRWDSTTVTSIAVTVTSDYTVAFIGTANGYLKKVVVESDRKAKEYASVLVDEGSPVNADLTFDRRQKHVYVVTEKKISRVRVQDCSPHTTCTQCLAANDPYCGWCTLENRCTKRTACSSELHRWLSYSDSRCTNIAMVIPRQVQVQSVGEKAKQLQLLIQNLPQPSDGEYQCAFSQGQLTRTTSASRIGNQQKAHQMNATLQCPTPLSNLLPGIPTGQDHIVMSLSVRTNGKDFVATNFTFFDCSVHTTCTECTNSDYPCTWCIKQHQCVHNRENCLTDTIITGKNVSGSTDTPGPEFCPRIEGSFTEILVASSTQKKVTVTAVHLLDFQDTFQCVFILDGNHKVVGATKIGADIIECDSVLFEYSVVTSSRNVPFQITWGPQKHPLDNPDIIQVKVYQCSLMADSCGACLTADTKYNCGWCDGRCTIQSQCRKDVWLDSSAICTDPTILDVHPLTGPKEGGTNVTITGKNLGKIFDDIKDSVIVAGVGCSTFRNLYKQATQIVCRTGRKSHSRSGVVQVIVSAQYESQSTQLFSYVEPKIRSFSPTRGPQSGGTQITIQGRHLNAGSRISATVAGLPCHIKQISQKTVVCVTSPSQLHNAVGQVKMKFDRGSSLYRAEQFHYVDDPYIQSVNPVKGILSGGTLIYVTGKHFDIIQEPQMVIYVRTEQYSSACHVERSERMMCRSPSVKSPHMMALLAETDTQSLHYGFLMDGVKAVRNMTGALAELGEEMFVVYADPTFDTFDGGSKLFQLKTEYLTINGHNLNFALTKDDVKVRIGDVECPVSSMSQTQLTCQPSHPEVIDTASNPIVKVFVGGNLSFAIGELHYEGPETRFPLVVIMGISIAAVILMAVIVIIVIAYRRKSRETNLVMKRMHNQMDMLEAKVAKECKEAFAELQTDMTELTNFISDGPLGIPFRDYRSFCMSVLFPNVSPFTHPVSRVPDQESDMHARALTMFDKLIGNKRFLLLFIDTLESDPNFSMRERVNVASLLSVSLQNRMEYHTDILKTLLADLIQKNIAANKEPKLFLRRCESVAEKMLSNWFTFLLHKFLLECAGEPLFVLFRAIKQQTDKGPVDAITSEGKYSLSEDKLIRQLIEYKPVTLHVLESEHQYGGDAHLVKVLDCDTISQVREKVLDAVYRNRPFSKRPHEDQIDLEWRTGMRGRITLQDLDTTSECEGEYKRYNTLAHYCVLDGDWVTMVTRQSPMLTASPLNQSIPSVRHAIFSGSPSLNRSLTPHLETDATAYHLVKPYHTELQKEGDRSSKMVSEIYLTRLLATKGSLQQYVDNLFQTIFSTTQRDSVLPLAIKYMFDFFDEQALYHGITDVEVVHTWKSNSLPLRFWITVVKNPDCVFDIYKSNIVDSCLSVVAQTLMDSCSMSDHCLSKDSPSSKLLYAKDIDAYKNLVESYFQEIKLMPAISDQDMNAMLAEESRIHQDVFNLNASLFEIYQYVFRYSDKLMHALKEDRMARNYQLARQLEDVHEAMGNRA